MKRITNAYQKPSCDGPDAHQGGVTLIISPGLKIMWSLWMDSKHKTPPLLRVSLEPSLPVGARPEIILYRRRSVLCHVPMPWSSVRAWFRICSRIFLCMVIWFTFMSPGL